MKGRDRNSKSLCENSMKMAVNIVKLSSFSIAKMSLGSAGATAGTKDFGTMTGSTMVPNEPLLSEFSGSQKSVKQWSSSKPRTFLIEPGGKDESSYVVQKEESNVIDGKASEYIKRVHRKYSHNLSETSKLSPDILPPPPPRVVM